jgi:hypothetical protein
MRHSKSNAYRGTNLTIVVIGLACATVVAAVGIFSRVSTLQRGGPAIADGESPRLSGHTANRSLNAIGSRRRRAPRFSSSALAGVAERSPRASP